MSLLPNKHIMVFSYSYINELLFISIKTLFDWINKFHLWGIQQKRLVVHVVNVNQGSYDLETISQMYYSSEMVSGPTCTIRCFFLFLLVMSLSHYGIEWTSCSVTVEIIYLLCESIDNYTSCTCSSLTPCTHAQSFHSFICAKLSNRTESQDYFEDVWIHNSWILY